MTEIKTNNFALPSAQVDKSPRYGVEFNKRHFKTVPGVLGCAEIIVGIICAACAGARICFSFGNGVCYAYNEMPTDIPNADGQGFVLCVVSICIILSSVLLVCHALSLDKIYISKWLPFSWAYVEIIYLLTAIVFYLIVAALESWYAGGYKLGAYKIYADLCVWVAAAVFMWVNFALYIVHSLCMLIITYRGRNDEPALPAKREPVTTTI